MEAERQNQQLEQTRRSIEQWRQTRVKLGAMPAPLWEAAAAVARTLGAYRVARDLGLNYLALKQRAFSSAGPPSGPRPATSNPAFVEVKGIAAPVVAATSGSAASDGAVIEMVAADGARLTIRVARGGLDLAALVASFR